MAVKTQQGKYWLFVPTLLFISILTWWQLSVSRAEPVRDRVLEDVRITEIAGKTAVAIRLPCPFQTLSHFPQAQGRELRIQIQPLVACNADRDAFRQRESFRPRHADVVSLTDVSYEGDLATGAYITLSFTRTMQWQLQTQNDFRGLLVLVSPLADGNEP